MMQKDKTPVTCIDCGKEFLFGEITGEVRAEKCPENYGATGVQYGHRIPRELSDQIEAAHKPK